ncbi:hypothetical protein M407DRAFT_142612 [Tulasnella calospora MUT 4182]|uniref:Uncharacterized protein n=1 Tax=Tulasnella calospora MUT 4182 TaxID=1051891 RepID=A0A0C3Q7F0_9AGAM|nr:hypothetical protein M407DRAFT_142612 [Tulasnella calospora MUT 4182]
MLGTVRVSSLRIPYRRQEVSRPVGPVAPPSPKRGSKRFISSPRTSGYKLRLDYRIGHGKTWGC